MGRTGARLKELERKNEILLSIICRQIVSNADVRHVLGGHNAMLGDMVEDIKKLEQTNFNHKQAINGLGKSVGNIENGNKIRNTVLQELTKRLIVIEKLLQPALNDITNLRHDSTNYKIELLSKNLDEAECIIVGLTAKVDKLENTAWKRFCRWIGRK